MSEETSIVYRPALVLDRTLDRCDAPKAGMFLLYESRVVWLVHPAQLPRYVRSVVIGTPDRDGPIKKRDVEVVGWSELANDATGDEDGFFMRRVFWLHRDDTGVGFRPGARKIGLVDPLTVRPGDAGAETPRMSDPTAADMDAVKLVTRSSKIDGEVVFWLEAVPLKASPAR